MTPLALLEVGRILGSIVAVWFGLVGWKLIPLARAGPHTRRAPE